MVELKVGDPVEVLDAGLLMLQQFAPKGANPNNRGFVKELNFGGEDDVLIEFPIGNGSIEEHSHVAPYPRNLVRLCKVNKV